MPQDDKILLTVVLAYATAIFLKGEIKHPVETIFDAPMRANRAAKGLSVARQVHDVVATLAGHLLAYLPLRGLPCLHSAAHTTPPWH